MPSWYVHIQAAGDTLTRLHAGVPAGSPLTQAQADELFEAGHAYRNYLAAGALGPDLFFLLPDFNGDAGKGLLPLVDFVLKTWRFIDDNLVDTWDQWVTPVLDEAQTITNALTGGVAAEVSEALGLLGSGIQNFALGMATQTQDLFGVLTSGTQAGYEDSAFYWSDMFHYRRTYQFARQLYANALRADVDLPAGEDSRVPKQQAFALGWMSHCATDTAAHPFTNAKCGGPFRTHWQRHHVIENHMDGWVYRMDHSPSADRYNALDVSALHARLAFLPHSLPADPAHPDDEPGPDWFPGMFAPPAGNYPLGETPAEGTSRRHAFDIETQPLPEHICQLLIKTMQDVYTGPLDAEGPQVLRWDPGAHVGDGGRPTVQVLQNMFQTAYAYTKFTTSSGLAPRKPMPPTVIGDHPFPPPPGLPPIDGNADPTVPPSPQNILDIIQAIVDMADWLADVGQWLIEDLPAIITEAATYPARELLHHILVAPAWDFYMLSRKPLVLQGFIAPKPEEISRGLVVLGLDERGILLELRADLDAPDGLGLAPGMTEASGLDPTPAAAAAMGGFSLDSAYPRALLIDLTPAWLAQAPPDAPRGPSEFVAPWRYPDHNMAGMRNGWEAPRTHVGPFRQGDTPTVLMAGAPGSDAARAQFEAATSPEETEAVSARLLGTPGQHLGDPIDYGMYLMGKLTGHWTSATGYQANDHAAPLPDFNLDSDRGYAYQCWDYLRHQPSTPPSPPPGLDTMWPDQWRCAPQVTTLPAANAADANARLARILAWYGYAEPFTVPQRYTEKDNPHHRSRYDPLKRLAHTYRPRPGASGPVPAPAVDLDFQVSVEEMRAAGMSPTGRRPV